MPGSCLMAASAFPRQSQPVHCSSQCGGSAEEHREIGGLAVLCLPASAALSVPVCRTVSHNSAAIMGRAACPVNGAARSVRPCGPPVLGFAPGPFRSAGLYSIAIASKSDGVSPRAPFEGLGHAVTIPGAGRESRVMVVHAIRSHRSA